MSLRVCYNVIDCIGNTPIIKLSRVVPENVKAEIWAKLEFMN
ncbi:MAG: cysteine synthase, partial [Thermoprotei archaeon]